MGTDTRQRGIMVYPMPTEVAGSAIYGRFALLVRSDGEARMVHPEGVTYVVSLEKPWTVRSTSPRSREPVTLLHLMRIALATQPVDLADWVRVFGSRLESNFYRISSWYNEAEDVVADGEGNPAAE